MMKLPVYFHFMMDLGPNMARTTEISHIFFPIETVWMMTDWEDIGQSNLQEDPTVKMDQAKHDGRHQSLSSTIVFCFQQPSITLK